MEGGTPIQGKSYLAVCYGPNTVWHGMAGDKAVAAPSLSSKAHLNQTNLAILRHC
jgi:hypothetical protein